MRRGLPILLVLGFSAPALAQECPGVRIAFRGSRWSAALSDRVRDELKVEVLRSGLCAQSGPTAAAQIDYVWEGREPLGVSVTFGSGAAQRTVARRLDPNGVPADGLPLVLAAVTGELLSEARAVLKVPAPEPAPPPAAPRPSHVVAVPPPPSPVVPTVPPEPRTWKAVLTARAAGEGWWGGQFQGGGDLVVQARWAYLAASVFAGGRAALVRELAPGVLHADALVFGAGGALGLWRQGRWELEAQLGLAGASEWVTPLAHSGWTGHAGQAWTLDGRAGLELAWLSGGIRWVALAGLDGPIRGLTIIDEAGRLEGVSGLGLYCALGGGWSW